MGKAHKLVDHIQMKRVIKIMVLIILFPVLTFAQLPDTLTKYFTPIPLQNPDSVWNVLKPALKGKKLFLFGEAHGVAVNHSLQLSLLKYLYKHAGVRHLILETSPADGYLHDYYLRTGDDKFLENSMYAYVKEERVFWQSLRTFNKHLPKKEQVRVFGVDHYEREPFIHAMHLMLFEEDTTKYIPQEMNDVYDQMGKSLANFQSHHKLRKLIKKGLEKYPDIYKQHLGKAYWHFKQILNSPLHRGNDRKRDKKMAQNILNIMKKFTKGNFFGIFGGCHTTNFEKMKNMKYYLAKSILLGSILNFSTHHKNCETYANGKKKKYTNIELLGYFAHRYVKQFDHLILFDISLIITNKELFAKKNLPFYEEFFLYIRNQDAYTFENYFNKKK